MSTPEQIEITVTESELSDSTQRIGIIEGVEVVRERDERRCGWWYTAGKRVGEKTIALRGFVIDSPDRRIGGLGDARAVCALVEAVLRHARENF